MTKNSAATTPKTSDLNSIRAIIDDVQAGFNRNDADLMNTHLAEDAIIVNARGVRLAGRPAIDEATREGLAAGFLRDATAYYQLTDIALLAPDVIAAGKNAWSTQQDFEVGNPPEMNALYIFIRRSGRWLIWRRQNTLIA